VSPDTHFSVRHAVRTLGLGEECLVVAELDERRGIDAARLRALLRRDATAREVFCIVATAGSTSTGAVDAMGPLADVAAERGAWLHVDGAYGLAYKLVPERSALYEGIDRADSVCWDPHKQFGVPIPSSVLFARSQADFARMAVFGTYFNRDERGEPNPGLKSVPSTRPLSALPLVSSILHQGLEGVVARLRAPLVAVEEVSRYLKSQADIELCHSPALGVVCFRFLHSDMNTSELDDYNRRIFRATNQRGERTVAITELDGRPALRLVAVSPVVTGGALVETVEALRSAATSC
jgi:L-2,4-diaminobutyrate decarboxylase